MIEDETVFFVFDRLSGEFEEVGRDYARYNFLTDQCRPGVHRMTIDHTAKAGGVQMLIYKSPGDPPNCDEAMNRFVTRMLERRIQKNVQHPWHRSRDGFRCSVCGAWALTEEQKALADPCMPRRNG
jgi:hypothetical protein